MPRHDDLVGAVIAHEIAHILGVGHAPSGVMRSDLQTADLLALRAGALTFDRHEVARLQHELAKANRPGAALDDTLVVRGAAQVRLPASTKAR